VLPNDGTFFSILLQEALDANSSLIKGGKEGGREGEGGRERRRASTHIF